MFRWILRLRWVAVAGQVAAMAVARFVFHLDLPWLPMFGCVFFTLFSNHLLHETAMAGGRGCVVAMNAVIFGDSAVLTAMLAMSGGIHNPFVGFHLLLITLAAMTLSGRALGALLVFTILETLGLSIWHVPFSGPPEVVSGGLLSYHLFLTGWAVCLSLIALCVSVFVHRLNQQLRHRDEELRKAERLVIEARQFQSLATLAAGVAHELGSPLGTIAIASKQMENTLRRSLDCENLLDDSRLIRSEVERCRRILDRLDKRSTRGAGESPRACSATSLREMLERQLSPQHLGRLEFHDHTADSPMFLCAEAVIQSLVVLVENACEADASGKPVSLDVRNLSENRISFVVMDSGPGIPDHLRHRIGDPFFSTKKEQSGMGLGLFLVRTLIGHLGGSCTIVPAAHGGTCATLILPSQTSSEKP